MSLFVYYKIRFVKERRWDDMNNGLFRKKSMNKVSSPEKLDEYIRVTTPSVWIALAAMVILLIGVIIWGCFGELTVHNEDGTTELVAPITYILN